MIGINVLHRKHMHSTNLFQLMQVRGNSSFNKNDVDLNTHHDRLLGVTSTWISNDKINSRRACFLASCIKMLEDVGFST